jgi:hypothetical protein
MKRLGHTTHHKAPSIRHLLVGTALALGAALLPFASTAALPQAQKRIYLKGIGYFDHEVVDANRTTGGQAGNPDSPLVGCDNAEKIWNYLVGQTVHGQRLTPQQVAGIMGNMQVESGFNPRRVQSTPTPSGDRDTPPAGDIGYGIVQWTPGTKIMTDFNRLRPLYAPAQITPGTLDFQLRLLVEQLNGQSAISEGPAGQDLVQQNTVAGALRSFMLRYERPRDQSESAIQEREPFAQSAFNRGTSGQWCQPQT